MNIYEVLKENAKNKPRDIMIMSDNEELTYRQVLDLVDLNAENILKETKGQKKRILLYLKHSYKIIISILAIIKTGNSYVPIKYGDEKNLKEVLKYCNTDIIFTEENKFSNIREITFSSDFNNYINISKSAYLYKDEDEVYILFTSGTTGKPKGCSVTYKNLEYILSNMIKINLCNYNSVYCFATPYTFDVSITEILGFIYGAKIYVCDFNNYTDFRKFPKKVEKYKITHFTFSPSGFKSMISTYDKNEWDKVNRSVNCIMLAGEAFTKDIFIWWKENNYNFRLINLYGTTETTVYSFIHELDKKRNYSKGVPIGEKLIGTDYYIDNLNEFKIGELIITGKGVSNGYINNIKENINRFIKTTDGIGYKTGDLVKYENGELYYHGRNDNQIQINGNRVELGEIESKILELEIISEAVVIFHNNLIIVFVKLVEEKNSSKEELIKILNKNLPKFMLPNKIIFIKEVPLTNHNKIDKKKLVDIYNSEIVDAKFYKLTKVEKNIIKLMEKSINKNKVKLNLNDDFYEFGGDSLSTVLLISNIEAKYNIELEIDEIYLLRTAKRISALLEKKLNEETAKKDYLGCYNDIVYDNKLKILDKQVFKYINHKVDKIKNYYESIYSQKDNYNTKVKSTLNFTYQLGEKFNYEQINNALLKLIKENPILFSKLITSKGKLMFEEYNIEDKFKFPYFENDKNYANIEELLINRYSNEIFKARYNNGLLSLFIIEKTDNDFKIVGMLDHTIADSNSISIIKNKLAKILNNSNNNESSLKYKDYCSLLRMNLKSWDYIYTLWYTKLLMKSKIKNKKYILKNLGNNNTQIKINNFVCNFADKNLKISQFIAYQVAKLLINKTNNEYIAVKTIINLREFGDKNSFKFKNEIGDFHSSISYIYEYGQSLNEFYKLCDNITNLYSKEFINYSFLKHENRFDNSEYTENLKKILEDSMIFSVNFLGILSDVEFNKFRKEISIIQGELYSKKEEIYVTSVINNNNLYIFINKEL